MFRLRYIGIFNSARSKRQAVCPSGFDCARPCHSERSVAKSNRSEAEARQRNLGRATLKMTRGIRREYVIVTEQKARVTYDNILRLTDDPDVRDVIKFLREREIVHFQRFSEALLRVQDRADQKNIYAINPAFDRK